MLLLSVTEVESADHQKAASEAQSKDKTESKDTFASTETSKKLEALKVLGKVTKLSSDAMTARVGDSGRILV